MPLETEIFRPSMKHVRCVGRLERASIANFAKVPEHQRRACINKLREILRAPASYKAAIAWAYQLGAGFAIGSDDVRFHFSTGMQVRNVLRSVLRDDMLPTVEQPSGDYASTWDDFYVGALTAALREEIDGQG